MKITDTNMIFDNSKSMIHELYEARIQSDDDAMQRAVLELKLYHLPPLFSIPVQERNKVPFRPEYVLFNESVLSFTRKLSCPQCQQIKHLYGVNTYLCLECWQIAVSNLYKLFPIRINSWSQIRNTSNYCPSQFKFVLQEPWAHQFDASTMRELQSISRAFLRQHPLTEQKRSDLWTSPKKTLLIHEIGCRSCRFVPSFKNISWFWSEDYSDWGNGYCPNCEHIDSETVWNLSPQEYRQWQDSYTHQQKLQRTIARYGALSLLLVNPSPAWVNYLTKLLPLSKQNRVHTGIISPKPIGHLRARMPRSLSDLSIDLDRDLPTPVLKRAETPLHPDLSQYHEANHVS